MNQSFPSKRANRTNGKIAGAFFILATTTAIIGLKLYDPVLQHQDYLTYGATHSRQVILGAVFELLLACANIGTGLTLYPYLKRYNESLGLGYVIFRLLEVVLILIGVISILGLLSLTQSFSATSGADVSSFTAIGNTLKAMHDWTFIIGPNFLLGINTSIYSYVFYKSGLVPRPLATLGITGALLIFITGILEMFGIVAQMTAVGLLLALPVAAYEMILAGWLIGKGFNTSGLVAKEPKQYPEPAFAQILDSLHV